MVFSSALALDEQVVALRSYLGERASKLSAEATTALCLRVQGLSEHEAAKVLRERLHGFGISLKHTHALNLVGRLSGRSGWNRPGNSGKDLYRMMVAAVDVPSVDETGGDPAKLLSRMCELISAHAKNFDTASVCRIRRSPREVMLDWDVMAPNGFIALIQAQPGVDLQVWQTFTASACERIRRAVEESGAPCFCDGFFVAAMSLKDRGTVEVAVSHNALELGRGNELQVFHLIESELGRPFIDATASMNTIQVGNETFFLSREYVCFEPLYEQEMQTLLHPDSVELLRRYRRLSQHLGKKIGDSILGVKKHQGGYGLPQTIPVNWKQVASHQSTQQLSDSELADKMGLLPEALAFARSGKRVDLSFFVQLVNAIDVRDLNTLVAKPSWRESTDVNDEPALRALLLGADEVHFVLGQGFDGEREEMLREAASDLTASRRLRAMHQAGQVEGPLDDSIFSVDAGEFLDAVHSQGATVRAAVIPCFQDASPEFSFPAVGRRAVLILYPREQAAAA
jgi:hypothetical protein